MKYRKKPIVIEAMRWTGKNSADVDMFCGPSAVIFSNPPRIVVKTLEGQMEARVGDYIIKGIKSEFYPCRPEIFEETYEPVEG